MTFDIDVNRSIAESLKQLDPTRGPYSARDLGILKVRHSVSDDFQSCMHLQQDENLLIYCTTGLSKWHTQPLK